MRKPETIIKRIFELHLKLNTTDGFISKITCTSKKITVIVKRLRAGHWIEIMNKMTCLSEDIFSKGKISENLQSIEAEMTHIITRKETRNETLAKKEGLVV